MKLPERMGLGKAIGISIGSVQEGNIQGKRSGDLDAQYICHRQNNNEPAV